MTDRFCVNLSSGPENVDKATVGFVVANAALASGKDVLVFLTVEAVRLGYRESCGGARRHVRGVCGPTNRPYRAIGFGQVQLAEPARWA